MNDHDQHGWLVLCVTGLQYDQKPNAIKYNTRNTVPSVLSGQNNILYIRPPSLCVINSTKSWLVLFILLAVHFTLQTQQGYRVPLVVWSHRRALQTRCCLWNCLRLECSYRGLLNLLVRKQNMEQARTATIWRNMEYGIWNMGTAVKWRLQHNILLYVPGAGILYQEYSTVW